MNQTIVSSWLRCRELAMLKLLEQPDACRVTSVGAKPVQDRLADVLTNLSLRCSRDENPLLRTTSVIFSFDDFCGTDERQDAVKLCPHPRSND